MREIKKHNLREAKTFHRFVATDNDSSNETGRKKKSSAGKFFGIFLWIIVFGVGIFLGYYAKPESEMMVEVNKDKDCKSQEESLKNEMNGNEQYQENINSRLEILKNYMHFIFSPKEEIENPDEYATMMQEKISMLGDEDLLQKFYATGDKDEEKREIRIIEFVDALVLGMKSSTE